MDEPNLLRIPGVPSALSGHQEDHGVGHHVSNTRYHQAKIHKNANSFVAHDLLALFGSRVLTIY